MDIYDDNAPFKHSLKSAFAALGEPDVSLVNVNLKERESDMRIFHNGLNVALSLDPQKAPIILYSMMSRVSLSKEMRFHALMGTRHIGFMKVPFEVRKVIELASELKDDQKVEDMLAWKLLRGFKQEALMGTLRHDLGNALNVDEARIQEVLQTAREKAGMTGADEDIIAEIMNPDWKPEEGMFPGERFSGVYCDIEGVLILKGGQINNNVVEILRSYERDGQPITLWTGGDTEKLSIKMIVAGLPWKVIPKQIFSGSTVQTVFDDESYEAFTEKYGIQCEGFTQI